MNQTNKKSIDPVSDKAILPLTINQINYKLIDDVTFQGQNYQTVSIVGRLEQFTKRQKFAILHFCDGTGVVEGRLSILDGKMSSFAEHFHFPDKNGEYFFVVLKPRFSEEGKKYNIVGIKEIDNYNSITKHFSDVILSYLIRTRK